MATATRIGQAVMRIDDGNIGITTDVVRKSGPNKGKLAAIFVGASWSVSVAPDEVEVIEVMRKPVES